ncbi:hypothetical protein BDW72DRAFT_204622 [Aspergillus terricola var. indicus]
MKGSNILLDLLLYGSATALLDEPLVTFDAVDEAVEFGNSPILRGVNDPVGIQIANDSLASDFEETAAEDFAVIAATAESPLISELEADGKISVEDIRGKWETSRTALIKDPLLGIKHSLVIVGSDKRGTMFGVFTLSEQIGKPPLHFWADVPVIIHGSIYALNQTTTSGSPSIKYRGIFINDEAPALTGCNEWKLVSDDLGGDWNWETNKENVVRYMEEGVKRARHNEAYFTIGMRGEMTRLKADDPIAVLKDVWSTQRELLAKYHGNQAVPQAWTVYKEVMTYYTSGFVPPDDLMLIFSDDNWGNVQRLPTDEERKRAGGNGLYYHFDYVGRPKSWKWQNNNNLPKVYKELSQAHERGADRIWVINTYDIKPMKIPISFAFDMAWNASRFDFLSISSYLEALAARDFGDEYAEQIASALLEYNHLAGLLKFEMIEPTTNSILNFREAERVLEDWRKLAERAQGIHKDIPAERRDALYHLLIYPAHAGHNYYQTLLGQCRNRQLSFERRNSANSLAQENITLLLVGNGTLSCPRPYSTWGFSPVLPTMNLYGPETRVIELFHRGDHRKPVHWSISVPYLWIQRLEVSIDWPSVPVDFSDIIQLRVEWDPSPPYLDPIHVPIRNTRVPDNFVGFPESGGDYEIAFKHIPYLGSRSRSGSIALRPYTLARSSQEIAKSAFVEFSIYLFNSTSPFNATVYINSALDTDPDLPMSYSLTVDDQPANFTRALADKPGDTLPGRSAEVADNVWKRNVLFGELDKGEHTLRWRVNSPEIYLEKIVLSLEEQLYSYLGVPETTLVVQDKEADA